jgi:hypothetical protein
MPQVDVGLVTYSEIPDLVPDDRLLLDELEARGLHAVPVVWDDPEVDWQAIDVCIIRETWDYHHRLPEFLAWVDTVAGVTTLLNPAHVVRWNSHKGYLRELSGLGLPVVPTEWLDRASRADLGSFMSGNGWERVVVKPVVSADSFETILVTRDTLREGRAHLERLLPDREMMVQPFLQAVQSTGERSLMFIAGEYTHAVRRQAPFGAGVGEMSQARLIEASGEEIALGYSILRAVGFDTLYARVDLAPDSEGVFRLMELELVEPSLFLRYSPEAVQKMAQAVEQAVPNAKH